LLAPPSGTRPLTDRVKQSLFAALVADGAVGEGTAFLDLFAGSGAAGIEALSLGAGRAAFVEKDRRACAVIATNVERASLSGARIFPVDALRFLAGDAPAAGAPFDACLVDPPYGDAVMAAVLEYLGNAARGWLRRDAVAVAKHFWRDEQPATLGALVGYRHKRFGETALTFYRYAP
jgi:16S rRNA (guanine966-N2)-methyltransferase